MAKGTSEPQAWHDVPGAAAFADGLKMWPFMHAGFAPAYEGLAGALASWNPAVCVRGQPGCGKSTLLACLPVLRPQTLHAAMLATGRILLAGKRHVQADGLAAEITADAKGLILSVELHSRAPSQQAVLAAAQMLYDLSTQPVCIVLAGAAEHVEPLLADDQFDLRSPVMLDIAALPAAETARYIQRRLAAAGEAAVSFSDDAATAIGQAAAGAPARINGICRRALAAAFVHGRTLVDAEIVEAALNAR